MCAEWAATADKLVREAVATYRFDVVQKMQLQAKEVGLSKVDLVLAVSVGWDLGWIWDPTNTQHRRRGGVVIWTYRMCVCVCVCVWLDGWPGVVCDV